MPPYNNESRLAREVEHKPFKRHNWLLDGVLPTRTTRYKFLQASITRRERSDIVQRLGEVRAVDLGMF